MSHASFLNFYEWVTNHSWTCMNESRIIRELVWMSQKSFMNFYKWVTNHSWTSMNESRIIHELLWINHEHAFVTTQVWIGVIIQLSWLDPFSCVFFWILLNIIMVFFFFLIYESVVVCSILWKSLFPKEPYKHTWKDFL